MDIAPGRQIACGPAWESKMVQNGLTRTRPLRGQKIDFFSKFLKTDGESKEMSGDIK